MYDVIVVGGGVVGASAAYHLARAGAKTLLLDARGAGRATDAGAGILSSETSGTNLPAAWFDFAIAAGKYYPALIEQLKDEGSGDPGYAVCGEINVAASEDELAAYEEKKRIVLERQYQRGLPLTDDLQEITPEEARERFPALKRVLKALYFGGAARVDGRLLVRAMLKAGQRYGLNVENMQVDDLLVTTDRVMGVEAEGSPIPCGKVVIAGGAWSADFGEQLGWVIPVEPQRGQIIHLYLKGQDTGQWPIVEAFHGHYLVGWPGGRVVAGATRENDSGFAVHTTAGGVHEVLNEALRVAPGLAGAVIQQIRVGLRPRTPDNLPILGNIPGVEGIYVATGHGANGLQAGPFSGKLAADWALGNPGTVDISAFEISRWKRRQLFAN